MPDGELLVRKATGADVAALSNLGSCAFKEAYGWTASPNDVAGQVDAYFSERVIAAEMGLATATYFTADLSGQCVGLVKIRASEVPEPIQAVSVMEIQQLYVDTSRQRAGIGHALVTTAVAHAQENSAEGVWLSVWENAHWAVGFYRKFGFEPVGRLPFHLGTTRQTDLLMYLPID